MPSELAVHAAEQMLGEMMVAVAESAARRAAIRAPGRAVPLQLSTDLQPEHVHDGRARAWAQLQPLPRARQLAVYTAGLDVLVGAPPAYERLVRQMLGNAGVRPPLEVAEPPWAGPTAPPATASVVGALAGLRALDAEVAQRAQAEFDAWQARANAPDTNGAKTKDTQGAAGASGAGGGDLSPGDGGAALDAAERACLRAFGAHDARTVQLTLANVARCVRAHNGAAARDRLERLGLAQAPLTVAQAGVLVGLLPLARSTLVAEADAPSRQRQAAHWIRALTWAHGEVVRAPQARAVAGQFARGARALQRVADGEQLLGDDDPSALEGLVEEVLDGLVDQGTIAAELLQRARVKLVELREGSAEVRYGCQVWLQKWLAVVTGYAMGELPRPLPAYDRGAAAPPRQLTQGEVERRLQALAVAFAARIVGNDAAYTRLENYLFETLRWGRPTVVLLHGEPGTGKGELAKLVARHAFADFSFFSRNLGGAEHANKVVGVSPTYHGSELSLFGEALAARRGRAVCFFIDEVDHASAEVQDALATALDFDDRLPFQDGYLGAPVRLQGDAMFFACNHLNALQGQLRSRLQQGLVLQTEVLGSFARRRLLRQRFRAELQADGLFADLAPDAPLLNDEALRYLEAYDAGGPGMRASLGAVVRLAAAARRGAGRPGWGLPLDGINAALVDGRDYIFDRFNNGIHSCRVGTICGDVRDPDWRKTVLGAHRCKHGREIHIRVTFTAKDVAFEVDAEHPCWPRIAALLSPYKTDGVLLPAIDTKDFRGARYSAPPGRNSLLELAEVEPFVQLLPHQRRVEWLAVY